MLDTTILLAAALVAGALNAVAGGGSFLTLPALVFTGVPPVVANATGTVALLPGYAAGAWGFKDDMQAPPGLSMKAVITLALLGGAAGAALLLVTPEAAFRKIVPWLLLAATAMFAFGPQLRKWATGTKHGAVPSRSKAALGMLAVSVYGGYFNGGLGILLMALYTLTGESRIHTVNALKNLNSFVLSLLSVLAFALAGAIVWPQALWMMVLATAGGWTGARLAKRLPGAWVRRLVIVTGLVMSALFFTRM
jgi:hypothetical protein